MRILHISDTHEHGERIFNMLVKQILVAQAKNQDFRIPDVIVHTGDIMSSGFNPNDLKVFLKFADFLKKREYSFHTGSRKS